MRTEEEIRKLLDFVRHFDLDKLVGLDFVLIWFLNDKEEK